MNVVVMSTVACPNETKIIILEDNINTITIKFSIWLSQIRIKIGDKQRSQFSRDLLLVLLTDHSTETFRNPLNYDI